MKNGSAVCIVSNSEDDPQIFQRASTLLSFVLKQINPHQVCSHTNYHSNQFGLIPSIRVSNCVRMGCKGYIVILCSLFVTSYTNVYPKPLAFIICLFRFEILNNYCKLVKQIKQVYVYPNPLVISMCLKILLFLVIVKQINTN